MLRTLVRLLHETATCGKSSVARRPHPAFLANLQAFDFDCGTNTSCVTHVVDWSIEVRDIRSSVASSSAVSHAGSTSGTTNALPSALRGRFSHWWQDRQPQLNGNASLTTGLQGQCRSLATTSGGPEGSDSSDTEQQQPEEPGSEVIEAASEADAVDQPEYDISKQLDLLMSDPTGQPLHPELRGARSWEPFVELDPDEGIEVSACQLLLRLLIYACTLFCNISTVAGCVVPCDSSKYLSCVVVMKISLFLALGSFKSHANLFGLYAGLWGENRVHRSVR